MRPRFSDTVFRGQHQTAESRFVLRRCLWFGDGFGNCVLNKRKSKGTTFGFRHGFLGRRLVVMTERLCRPCKSPYLTGIKPTSTFEAPVTSYVLANRLEDLVVAVPIWLMKRIVCGSFDLWRSCKHAE